MSWILFLVLIDYENNNLNYNNSNGMQLV